jgi:hypothetical protein
VHAQRDRVKEIDIHTWSRGSIDNDTGLPKDKIRGKELDWGSGYRLI